MIDTSLKPSAAASALDADFESTVTFTSAADAVFDALTTLAGLAGWWCSDVSGFGLAGGELTFRFSDPPLVLRVDQAERPAAVKWTTVASELTPEWLGTTISFAVSPTEQGGSRLHFRHAGLTPRLECFGECSTGWVGFLVSLVNYVDLGKGAPFSPSDATG